MLNTRVVLATVLVIAGIAVAAGAYDRTPIGAWEWLEYQEDEDSHTYPVDAGYTAQRMFLSDGTYFEFRDEELVATGEFVYGESEIYPGQTIPYISITIDGTTETFAYHVYPEDVLTIYYGHVDWWPDYPVDRFVRRAAVVATERSTWAAVKLLYR